MFSVTYAEIAVFSGIRAPLPSGAVSGLCTVSVSINVYPFEAEAVFVSQFSQWKYLFFHCLSPLRWSSLAVLLIFFQNSV